MSRVLAISGSIRTGSFNTQVLQSLQPLAPNDMSIEVYKGIDELPHFNQDLEAEPPTSVVRLREAIESADGLIISTPEYNRHIPGVLKNALDWASRPYAQGALVGKNAMVMSASPSAIGGFAAQIQLRSLLGLLGTYVVGGGQVAIPEVHTRLTVEEEAQAAISDEATRGLLVQQLNALQRAIANDTGATHNA
jgi:chromate reductase